MIYFYTFSQHDCVSKRVQGNVSKRRAVLVVNAELQPKGNGGGKGRLGIGAVGVGIQDTASLFSNIICKVKREYVVSSMF